MKIINRTMQGSGCGGWGTAHLAVWNEASNQQSQKFERLRESFQRAVREDLRDWSVRDLRGC